jgi:signal-transduction protein with cAMP-binding, CBS, and nucleotidyltransferase domain
MIREYFRPLRMTGLMEGARLYRPARQLHERVTLESSALEVMTDLAQFPALTIEAEAAIEAAHAKMIGQSVRLLFITDARDHVLGLITATDLLGEKVVQAMQASGVSRQELRVREIMTPRERLEVISIEDIRGAKVGHVVSTLQQAGRQHAIVVEAQEPTFHERLAILLQPVSSQTVRGLFSTTQIARQLGLQLHSLEIATTFAEVEALLSH